MEFSYFLIFFSYFLKSDGITSVNKGIATLANRLRNPPCCDNIFLFLLTLFFSVARYLTIFFLPHKHFKILSLNLFFILMPLFLRHVLYMIQQILCILSLSTTLVKFFICVSFNDEIILASSSIFFFSLKGSPIFSFTLFYTHIHNLFHL